MPLAGAGIDIDVVDVNIDIGGPRLLVHEHDRSAPVELESPARSL